MLRPGSPAITHGLRSLSALVKSTSSAAQSLQPPQSAHGSQGGVQDAIKMKMIKLQQQQKQQQQQTAKLPFQSKMVEEEQEGKGNREGELLATSRYISRFEASRKRKTPM